MGALRQREIFHTIEEYLAFENHAESRHEYLQGEIYAMAGATPRHNDIAGNIFNALKNQLRGRGCIPRISDQRLYVAEAELLTYPDVLVVCPPQRYSESDSIALVDATLLAEVLSPSTVRYDQGAKFESYGYLPSFRHYLLVEQSRMEVEHRFLRDGEWRSEIFTSPDQQIHLEAIDCSLSVSEIYEEIEF